MMHNGDIQHSCYLVHHYPLEVGRGGGECLGQGQPGKRRKAWKGEEGASPSCFLTSVDVLLDPSRSRLNWDCCQFMRC